MLACCRFKLGPDIGAEGLVEGAGAAGTGFSGVAPGEVFCTGAGLDGEAGKTALSLNSAAPRWANTLLGLSLRT